MSPIGGHHDGLGSQPCIQAVEVFAMIVEVYPSSMVRRFQYIDSQSCRVLCGDISPILLVAGKNQALTMVTVESDVQYYD